VRAIGDYNFDPLNLGTEETFVPFREAEIKHGRLAMLAAVAWPLQEILHPIFVDILRSNGVAAADAMAETNGFSPSLLNGGLLQFDVAPTLALAIFMASVLELKDMKARAAKGLAWNEYDKAKLPGDLSFDPLRITRNMPTEQKIEFLEKELMNGRLAMIAITCYVAEEVLFGSAFAATSSVARAHIAAQLVLRLTPKLVLDSHPPLSSQCRLSGSRRTCFSRSSSRPISAASWTEHLARHRWTARSTASRTEVCLSPIVSESNALMRC